MEAEETGLERAAEQQQESARMKEEELQRLESARHHDLDELTCAAVLLVSFSHSGHPEMQAHVGSCIRASWRKG